MIRRNAPGPDCTDNRPVHPCDPAKRGIRTSPFGKNSYFCSRNNPGTKQNGLVYGSFYPTFGHSSRRRAFADFGVRHDAGQSAFFRNFARRDVRLLHRHRSGSFWALGRSFDAGFRRKFRARTLRLCIGIAGGSRFLQFAPFGRHPAGFARHAHRPDRFGTGRRARLCGPRTHERHGRHPVRRHDQHSGARCGATDALPDAVGQQQRHAGLRTDLSAGCRGRDSGHHRRTQTLRPALGHSATGRRT